MATTSKNESKNDKTPGRDKAVCPISLATFKDKATPLSIKIGDQMVVGEVKEFSTGSFGWYSNAKVMIQVGDKVVAAQVGLNLIVVGSKEAPKS